MAAEGSTEGRSIGDLPIDLLSTIYRRCSTRHDRASFSAVCTSWRAAALWLKLPGVPLLLNTTANGILDRKALAYSPEDGKVLHDPLRWFPYGKRIVGCHEGGWVAAARGWRLDIVNLFTRAWVLRKGEMPCRYDDEKSIEKIIFSKDPSSEGCILAVLTRSCIALYKIEGPGGGWITRGCGMRPRLFSRIIDIAFCNGDIYGLTFSGNSVYKLIIAPDTEDPPMLFSVEELIIERPKFFYPKYIFDLGGKVATALEVRPASNKEDPIFRVFELATSGSSKFTWAEVTSLGDHALFLGPGCCKAVPVSAEGMRGEVEGNRIYYSNPLNYYNHLDDDVDSECLTRLDLGSCAVYCYKSKEEVFHSERIMSRGFHYREKDHGINGRNSCTWILPPYF